MIRGQVRRLVAGVNGRYCSGSSAAPHYLASHEVRTCYCMHFCRGSLLLLIHRCVPSDLFHWACRLIVSEIARRRVHILEVIPSTDYIERVDGSSRQYYSLHLVVPSRRSTTTTSTSQTTSDLKATARARLIDRESNSTIDAKAPEGMASISPHKSYSTWIYS